MHFDQWPMWARPKEEPVVLQPGKSAVIEAEGYAVKVVNGGTSEMTIEPAKPRKKPGPKPKVKP